MLVVVVFLVQQLSSCFFCQLQSLTVFSFPIRCQDPTELKTHLGSIKCPECGDIADPINNQWKCDQGCLTNQEDGLNVSNSKLNKNLST